MAQQIEAAGLTDLRPVQANIAMCQDVFLHHIGQVVSGGLALFGQPVQAS